MKFWQHMMITFSLLFPFIYGTGAFYGAMAFAIFGSIFPDVDVIEIKERGSPLTRIMQAVKMVLYYPISAAFSVILLRNVAKHRGFAHTLMAAVIFSGILFLAFHYARLNLEIAFFFFIGYALHIIEDCFTPSGTEPFLPSRIRIFGRIGTSSPLLAIISFCFLAPVILFLLSYVNIENAKNLEIIMLALFAMTLKIG
ncbi:MAG: metal-dependent hydrolase [Candidatus Micrarchaeota archaeon]|nr:metal-dependent hydrolase [Candidatus Micrarchaeota archaeon]